MLCSANPGYFPAGKWHRTRAAHESRACRLLRGHEERRSANSPHPVFDFLFEYYSFRPGNLKKWSPGAGIVLEAGDEGDLPFQGHWVRRDGGFMLDLSGIKSERRGSLLWILELLRKTRDRSPRYGCQGLHEWAMVYEAGQYRHEEYSRLRMDKYQVRAFLESRTVCCSHFDAFRFFTDAARPRNVLGPSRENRLEMEQRGCLHVNMDLYKWAGKFWPWIDSELVLDCFELALDARILDMRASPYDLAEFGFEPLRIETPEGEAEYEYHQRQIAEKAVPLRTRLLEQYEYMALGLGLPV